MKPRIKVGLLVGAIGLVLNICVAGFMGICGPFVSLIGGALAGFFTARQEHPLVKGDGAKAGAIAGAIAGGIIVIGQIIGGVIALAFVQFNGKSIFGAVPPPTADASQQVIYYVTGMFTGLCFGLVGAVLAALAGAAAGYFGSPDQPPSPNIANM